TATHRDEAGQAATRRARRRLANGHWLLQANRSHRTGLRAATERTDRRFLPQRAGHPPRPCAPDRHRRPFIAPEQFVRSLDGPMDEDSTIFRDRREISSPRDRKPTLRVGPRSPNVLRSPPNGPRQAARNARECLTCDDALSDGNKRTRRAFCPPRALGYSP